MALTKLTKRVSYVEIGSTRLSVNTSDYTYERVEQLSEKIGDLRKRA